MPITGSQKALMYALGGVARGGATRGGYTSRNVFISVAGTEYGEGRADPDTSVLLDSMSITDVLGDTPNSAMFQTVGFAPADLDEVIVRIGSKNKVDPLFAGYVLNSQKSYIDKPANTRDQVRCTDYTWLLGQRFISGQYTGASVTDIAIDLVTMYAPDFSTGYIERGLDVLDSFSFTNQRLRDVLTQLCNRIGAQWKADYNKHIRLFLTADARVSPPLALTSTHPTLRNFSDLRDASQQVNRVSVEGGGVNALSAVDVGDTILPVDNGAWYSASGGMVAIGNQRVTYASRDLGGAGALVGPGASPTSAPGLALVGGTGLEAGAHQYAYTDVTAAGESLPSPVGSVTTGQLADPAAHPGGDTNTPGNYLSVGTYQYAHTFANAAGETIPSPVGTLITDGQVADPVNAPTANAAAGGTWAGGTKTLAFAFSFYDIVTGVETALGPTTVFGTLVNGNTTTYRVDCQCSADARPNRVRMYFSLDGGSTWAVASSGTVNYSAGNVVTSFVSISNTGAAGPTNTYVFRFPQLSIPLGPTGTTSRKIYRTVANGSQLKLLATIADNTTSAYADSTADASLGANAPTSNTALTRQVSVTGIAVGASGTTSRKLYRSAAGASQLKLLATLADNTTTTYADSTADASLGANAPTSDTSGLSAGTGQILAGATSLVTSGAGAFASSGGWAVIGNGRQVIRYTGLSGNSLIGIPATGTGALTASVSYGSTITAAPQLTGIPAGGTGAIQFAIIKGDPVNIFVQVDDTVAQAARAAKLGANNAIQDYIIQDGRIGIDEAQARGEAQLAFAGAVVTGVDYEVRDPNTRAGRTVTVDLNSPTNVHDTFLLQQVTVSGFVRGQLPVIRANGSSRRFTFEDLLRLARKGATTS